MNTEIQRLVRILHEAIWEEIRAPVGHYQVKAHSKRESAERSLRRKLAMINPRDMYGRENEAQRNLANSVR